MRSVWIDGERNESNSMSSARVQTILTGLPMALVASAAGTAVAVEPLPEAAAEEISAHNDPVLADTERPGQHRQHQRLPLITGADLENAVPLESERIYRLQLEMQCAARRVGPLQGRFRGGERGLDTWIVHQQ